MSRCYAYIRVSTTKQAEQGVSLEAQRGAIERYAERSGLTITEWFTESQTAAKRGRSEFNRMLRLLRQNRADGVVVHKIDRSARNLRDWADFAELVDRGVKIHLAAESLDLTSRGGRLSADIQAVVAADYIRNLRDETLKGIRGRYRQGLLPGRAPLGYLNGGPGKLKTIDPVKGPLVKEMFERYATGQYTLHSICSVMNKRGLRNLFGSPLDKNGASRTLHNRFYVGIVGAQSDGEAFPGQHVPLITAGLFEKVQRVLAGTSRPKEARHDYLYRRLFTCGGCDFTLIPERQKGHIYYRCHTKGCLTRCLREERVDESVVEALQRISLSEPEGESLRSEALVLIRKKKQAEIESQDALQLKMAALTDRLDRLTDLLLDQAIDREAYEAKKQALSAEKALLALQMRERGLNPGWLEERIDKFLELATEASLTYEKASAYWKREMLLTMTSNRVVSGENVVVELRKPFQLLADWRDGADGGPSRDVPRTFGSASTVKTTADKPDVVSSQASLILQLMEFFERSVTDPGDPGFLISGSGSRCREE